MAFGISNKELVKKRISKRRIKKGENPPKVNALEPVIQPYLWKNFLTFLLTFFPYKAV